MANVQIMDEDNLDKEKDNVVTFEPKLLIGGKEPPSTGDTWLDKLEVGTCFLVADNNPMEFMLGLFRISERIGKATVLNSPAAPGNLYVNPISFCRKYRLYETVGVLMDKKEEEQKEGTDDGDREPSAGGSPEGKVE